MRHYLIKTPVYSQLEYHLKEFKWREFRFLQGAEDALECLQAGLYGVVEDWSLQVMQQDIQLEDADDLGSDVISSQDMIDENNLKELLAED